MTSCDLFCFFLWQDVISPNELQRHMVHNYILTYDRNWLRILGKLNVVIFTIASIHLPDKEIGSGSCVQSLLNMKYSSPHRGWSVTYVPYFSPFVCQRILHFNSYTFVSDFAQTLQQNQTLSLQITLTTMADVAEMAPNNTTPPLPPLPGVTPLEHSPHAGYGQNGRSKTQGQLSQLPQLFSSGNAFF